jgi:hypothetical protein
MEIKDFFKLVLKLIAIFYGLDALFTIASSIQYYAYGNPFLNISTIWMIVSTLLPVLVYYLIFVQSDKLIRFLKIDKGFEGQKVQFGNLTSNEILKIAFIIFGLLMIVWGLPSFLTNCFYALKYSAGPQLYEPHQDTVKVDYYELTRSGIYILMGYLTVSNYKRIAKWFDQ